MIKKILVVGDLDFNSSGYMNIIINLCKRLVPLGYEIKCAGISYEGQEHDFPFSIIPASNLGEAAAVMNNLCVLWKPDILLTAFDIPLQQQFLGAIERGNLRAACPFKHIAITALENGPLVADWALVLSQIDKVFFISQLGTDEAKKTGLDNVEHIVIGIDTDVWKPLTKEDRETARKNLGFEKDDFIIITVADNQERKNLLASLNAVKLSIEFFPRTKHILVTREHNLYGWKLSSLINSLGLIGKVFIYERGMPADRLRLLYGISDVFLLLSRAEGLGMPILEAMAVGIPCVCTDTGAMHELLTDGRGKLVKPEYEIDLDTWGNSKRSFADPLDAFYCIKSLVDDYDDFPKMIKKMKKYVTSRTWDIPTEQVDRVIKELTGEEIKEISK